MKDDYTIQLKPKDFIMGNLRQTSNIRPNRLFTAYTKIALYKAGRVDPIKLKEVIKK